MKYSLGISNFLEEISSLSHSVVFFYFFALKPNLGVRLPLIYHHFLKKFVHLLGVSEGMKPFLQVGSSACWK